MKDSYLCIVNESVRECSQGTKNLFSGLTDFTQRGNSDARMT